MASEGTAEVSRPLEGVRVLDLTNVLAGPYCCYQLALLGAEVIKVERPGSGDLARKLGASRELNDQSMGASFLAQNAGKKSLTLDLKDPRGKDLFLRLAATADVLVENFRPGVMARLGLDFDTLAADNPRLVYCAITGFGQSGPLRDRPAYDQIIQGFSGVMSITGGPDSAPLRVGYPVSDTIGGLTAAYAIMAALLQRQKNGQGTFIDVSMLEATLSTMGWIVSNYLIADQRPEPMGNENFTASPSGTFATRDRPLNIAANQQAQFRALCEVIGREDLLEDPRFSQRDTRKKNRAELRREIESVLRTRPAAEWEERLTAVGVPAGPVMTIDEVLTHPHIAERELIQHFEQVPGTDLDASGMKAVTTGFTLSGARPRTYSPPPTIGADTAEILMELGLDGNEIQQLKEEAVI